MHLPLLTRCLFLLVQFLILTMALPNVSVSIPSPPCQALPFESFLMLQQPLPPQSDDLTERDALPVLEAEDQDSAARIETHASGRKFGRRVRVNKGPMGSPVEAKVGERDLERKKDV